jgi:hypothetical protein
MMPKDGIMPTIWTHVNGKWAFDAHATGRNTPIRREGILTILHFRIIQLIQTCSSGFHADNF